MQVVGTFEYAGIFDFPDAGAGKQGAKTARTAACGAERLKVMECVAIDITFRALEPGYFDIEARVVWATGIKVIFRETAVQPVVAVLGGGGVRSVKRGFSSTFFSKVLGLSEGLLLTHKAL